MIKANDVINNRYKIIGVVGHGGMSDVYEAKDIIFKRHVTIKVLNDRSKKKIANIIRFQNEAKFSSSLKHKNIIETYDCGEIDGLPYIVSEYAKGQTLRDALDFKQTFSISEACSIMIQLCDALIYVHSKHIVHRDIKSSNVFIEPDGSVKLTDFGISISLDSDININENSRIMGTAQYLAPELIKGATASYQSDIYAMGILFYELITGKVPFDGKNPAEIASMHLKNKIPSPLKVIPNLPKECEKIIYKATDKNLNKRYKTVNEMKEDITSLYKNKKAMRQGKGLLARIFGLSSN